MSLYSELVLDLDNSPFSHGSRACFKKMIAKQLVAKVSSYYSTVYHVGVGIVGIVIS